MNWLPSVALLALVDVAEQANNVYVENFNRHLVAASQRDGHNYMTEVDTVDGQSVFYALTYAKLRGFPVYGKFDFATNCSTFYAYGMAETRCDDSFFFLHSDFYMIDKMMAFSDDGKTVSKCNGMNIHAGLFKTGLKAVKQVATIEHKSSGTVTVYMHNHVDGTSNSIENAVTELESGLISQLSLEYLCFKEHNYT